MTTTLRPMAEEERGPRGERIRRYAVCANSRRVGEVLLRTRPSYGPLVGELAELHIDEGERRRGRATVAALAAEEVLRQWGCVRLQATVPGDSEAGMRLASALGYSERNRNLAKRLGGAPALPPGCAARAFTAAEFPAWLDRKITAYAADLAGVGYERDEARAKSEADHYGLLPEGVHSQGALLRVLSRGGVDVGTLWVALAQQERDRAWVFDVEVAEEHRGSGHGRTLMELAEAECVAAGMSELALNVFASNTPAVSLYASLGYRVVTHYLSKPML